MSVRVIQDTYLTQGSTGIGYLVDDCVTIEICNIPGARKKALAMWVGDIFLGGYRDISTAFPAAHRVAQDPHLNTNRSN